MEQERLDYADPEPPTGRRWTLLEIVLWGVLVFACLFVVEFILEVTGLVPWLIVGERRT